MPSVYFADPRFPLDPAVIGNVVLAAAPERADNWHALVSRYSLTFYLVEDRKGVTMQAGNGQIEFDAKTMAWLWLLGFSGWQAFCLHGPHLLLRALTQRPIDAAMRSADQGYADAEAAFDTVLYVTRDLAQIDHLDEDHDWPTGIPPRQPDKTGFDIEQQAAFDLTITATAYVLLHEVRHIMFDHETERPSKPKEELCCDKFARDFILGEIPAYAARSGEQVAKVMAKRAMGVALGAYVVYEITAPEIRGGTDEYPPFADRLDALIVQLQPDDDSCFWDFAASLLIALLMRRNQSIAVPEADGRALCEALIGEVRKMVLRL